MKRGPEHPGVRMTLAQMRDYVQNPPSIEAERTINGAKPVARMEKLAKRREEMLWKTMEGRYNQVLERATERVNEADEALDLLEAKIDGWLRDLKSGRLSPDDAMANLRQVPPVLADLQSDYDMTTKDAEAALAFIETSVEVFESASVARLPVLANSLPEVTSVWLTGDDDTDPLGVA